MSSRTTSQLGSRFLLWVDGVGGYLICTADEVAIGRASQDTDVEVPISSELSQRQVSLRRQPGGYIVQPHQAIKIDTRPITTPTILAHGDELEIGSGVAIRFTSPHSLCASARLDFISRHRTQPKVDAVILMADAMVLGPNWNNHVVAEHFPTDVVLYRQGDEFFCRSKTPLEIDGVMVEARGKLSAGSRIVSQEYSMTVEAL